MIGEVKLTGVRTEPLHRVPKPFVRASFCLLAGAVISQLVGYAFAVKWQLAPTALTWQTVNNTNATRGGEAMVGTGFGVTSWRVNRYFTLHEEPLPKVAAPEWAMPRTYEPRDAYDSVGFGWPLPSVAFGAPAGLSAPVSTGSITIDSSTGKRLYIPLRFIWGNFVINSVIYAVPVAGAWAWLAARRRAAARGLCQSCHYPRKGLTLTTPCPECGTSPSSTSSG